jgi:acyl-CoA thioester hydrolase
MARTDQTPTQIKVRDYELDANGHVAGAVMLQYSQHARWECLQAAGIDHDRIYETGIAPVSLKETIDYHRELRSGEEIEVSCEFKWGEGKTFQVEQELRRADGALVAEVTNVGGLLDLRERRLVPDPAERWRSLASAPGILGLDRS